MTKRDFSPCTIFNQYLTIFTSLTHFIGNLFSSSYIKSFWTVDFTPNTVLQNFSCTRSISGASSWNPHNECNDGYAGMVVQYVPLCINCGYFTCALRHRFVSRKLQDSNSQFFDNIWICLGNWRLTWTCWGFRVIKITGKSKFPVNTQRNNNVIFAWNDVIVSLWRNNNVIITL